MMKFSKLAAQAKKAVDAAGGPDAVKDKAAGLRKVAQGKGSLSDKAKQAMAVAREDGNKAAPTSAAAAADPAPVPSPTAPEVEGRRHRRGGGGNRA